MCPRAPLWIGLVETAIGMVSTALAWYDLVQPVYVAPPIVARFYTMGAAPAQGLVARAVLWCILVMGAGGDYSILFLILQMGREAWYEIRGEVLSSKGEYCYPGSRAFYICKWEICNWGNLSGGGA